MNGQGKMETEMAGRDWARISFLHVNLCVSDL